MVDSHTAPNRLQNRCLVNLDAVSGARLVARQVGQELPIAAPEIEHAGPGRHQALDQFIVKTTLPAPLMNVWSMPR
jgi:hypothetical protein